MKTCTKCKEEKPKVEFYKETRRRDKLSIQCKICVKKRKSLPEISAKERALKKRYVEKNRSMVLTKSRENYKQNRDKILKEAKLYRDRPENKSRQKAYMETYREENREMLRYKENKKYADNKDEIRIQVKYRYDNDPMFRIASRLRNTVCGRLRNAGYTKKSRTYELLGLDFETVWNYLEYTWFQNYGTELCDQEYHIDHIIPCASASTEEELIALQHYSNLQLLTPEDNLSKGDKYESTRIC